MLKDKLTTHTENELHDFLLELYTRKIKLTSEDIEDLSSYDSTSYSLLGIIGLLLNEKARVLLGRKQTYHKKIQELCSSIEVTRHDIEVIADWDIKRNLSETEQYIFEKVMLEYPPK